MSDHLSKGEFEAHILPMREDIKALVELQREANGRTGKIETRIAILEERSPGNPGRVASIVSAVVSGAITGLAMLFGSKQ